MVTFLPCHHHRTEELLLNAAHRLVGLYFDTPTRNFLLNLLQFVFKVGGFPKHSIPLNHSLRLRIVEELSVVQLVVIDARNLLLVKPLYALAVFPQPKFKLFIFGDEVSANTMLFASVPVSLVAAAISPCINAKPVLLIVFVLTLIDAAIIPNVNAHTLHIIFKPFAFIASAIEP